MDLFINEQIEQELNEYRRHLYGDYDYILDIEPIPAPRVRARALMSGGKPVMKNGVPIISMYNPTEYTKYKNDILREAKKIIKTEVPQNRFYCTFYIPYPASTPKKKLIDGAPHKKTKDVDNFTKGILDGLQGSPKQNIIGIIKNDATIDTNCCKKVYTTKPNGYIAFSFY